MSSDERAKTLSSARVTPRSVDGPSDLEALFSSRPSVLGIALADAEW